MAKAKKVAPPKKRKYKKRDNGTAPMPVTDVEPLEIEENPPPPLRGASLEKLAFLHRLEKTLETLKTGQAFIIPLDKKHTVDGYLRRNYSTERWQYMRINGNPKSVRVYRLAYDKKK